MVRAALVLATCSLLLACSSGEDALQRGDSFWADSNYTQALAEYRRSIDRYPNRALYHAQLAWTLHLAGREAEARAAAEIAKQLDDRNPHRDQKLSQHKVVDPQVGEGGAMTLQHADSAEQIALRLRTTSGNGTREENAP